MSVLQIAVAITCLVGSILLALYVLLLLLVLALRERADQLDIRVAHLEDDPDAEVIGYSRLDRLDGLDTRQPSKRTWMEG